MEQKVLLPPTFLEGPPLKLRPQGQLVLAPPSLEKALKDLLDEPLFKAPEQDLGLGKYEPAPKDVYPEVYIRKLAAGGYVVGVEVDLNEKQVMATGETVAEAVRKLQERLAER